MNKQPTRRYKRYKAKRLFFTKRYSSKQICEMVGVTQATMSNWIKIYGWKNPENAGSTRKIKVLGLISMDFCNFLEANNPVLLDAIVYELKVFTGANNSITVGQAEELKDLTEKRGLNAKDQYSLFSQIAERPVHEISKLKNDEAAYLIEFLSTPDKEYELTIKKVNP